MKSRTSPRARGLWFDAWVRLRRNRAAVISLWFLTILTLACLVQPTTSAFPYDKANLALGATAPSWEHWMGTDDHGRDLMSRVLFGGRVSLAVAVIASALSFMIGVTWGGFAGYFGGRVDALMMGIVDVLYTFPLLIIVILLTAFFANPDTVLYDYFVSVLGVFVKNPKDPSYLPVFKITFVFMVLGSMSWLTMARIVRGQVIALKGQLFVEAARTIGVSHLRMVARHILPNALGPIIVYATLSVPELMMTEAFLSFLGLGTEEPLASWGQLVSTGVESLDLTPWLTVFPGMFLAATLFCCNFLGDGLRDALDPRARRT